MARDRDTDEGKAPRAPVSAHPAFPLIVGLWFAALLGLGTIVMPAVVIEQAASLTGLTEPPLTAAARATIALAATILGLIGGLMLARKVVEAQQVTRAPRRRAPNPVGRQVRPLSVHDDLGEEAIAPTSGDARPKIAGRRRALAVIEDERPSDFLMAAPLPGGEPAETPELTEPEPPAPELPEDAMSERPSDIELPAEAGQPGEELDLSQLVAESPIYDPPAHEPTAEQPPADAQVFAPAGEVAAPEPYVPALDTRKPRDLVAPAAPEPADEPAAPVVASEPAASIDGDLKSLGMVQLAERLGRSMQQRLAAQAEAPQPEPEPVAEAEPLEFSAPSLDHPEPAEEELAMPPPVVPDALRAFMDVAPEEPAAEEEPIAVPPPVVPAALQPFAFEHDDDDELDPGPFTLPLGSMPPRAFDAPPVPVAAEGAVETDVSEEDEEETEDAHTDDGSFSSLLSMKNPFRAAEEFVRIDEPEAEDGAVEPAVVFPGQEAAAAEPVEPRDEAGPEADPSPARPFDAPHQAAPSTAPVRPRAAADPVETERALRAALANLQRMSGTA